MYESFEPWHLRDDYKVKKVHAHSPPLSKKAGLKSGGGWMVDFLGGLKFMSFFCVIPIRWLWLWLQLVFSSLDC